MKFSMLTFKIHEQLSSSLTVKEFVLRNEKCNSLKVIFVCGQKAAKFLLTFYYILKSAEIKCENNRIQQ